MAASADGARPATRAHEHGPVWPVTLLVVVSAYLLSAWNLYGAGIVTAPFFGEIPSRDDYIRGGMAALTGVLPCVLFAVAGRLAGSRWGLVLIALPAVALLAVGLSMLSTSGDPVDPLPGRAVRPTDVVDELTYLNWIVSAGLALVIAGLSWSRRRRG